MKSPITTIYIVTPCFNALTTIERTILSVVTQAGNFRIRFHVQDGGSTDGTLDILRRWRIRLEAKDFPIQCRDINFTMESAPDRGIYDALIKGFAKLAIPPEAFMTWINADDILMPGALSLVAHVAASFDTHQVSWLSGAAAIIKNDMPIVQVDRPSPTCVIKTGLCDGKHWHFMQQEGVFFRHCLWSSVDMQEVMGGLRFAGDWNLWRTFACHANLVEITWPLGAFRLREGQLSQVNGTAYMAEIDSLIAPQSRLASLKSFGDDGGSKRFLLKARYPSGQLYIVEKSGDAQVYFYYKKAFGNPPPRSLEDQSEAVLFEGDLAAVVDKPGMVREEPKKMNDVPPRVELPPRPEFFDHYTYAKRSHWSYFEGLDKAVYGQKKKPDKVQLKVYQSLLLLRFIQEMIPAGARILYVGSGLPRILTYLAKVHECWNIDKSDPGNVSPPGKAPPYRLVCDQMGRFSRELPNDYFDLVFSIYAPQGVSQQGPEVFGNIIADIDRVLKPGGWSLHLFSVVLSPDTFQKNKFSDYIFDNVETVNKAVNPDFMKRDPDLYTISEEVYNETLLNSTKRSYQEYGRPTSSHILWQKSA